MRDNGVSTDKPVEALTIFDNAVKAMDSTDSATNNDKNIRSAYDSRTYAVIAHIDAAFL